MSSPEAAAALQVRAQAFWEEFSRDGPRPRLLLGRNIYMRPLLDKCRIDGIVDDYFDGSFFEGVPILRSEAIPADALVLSLAGGRPRSALERLQQRGIACLDYFSLASLRIDGLLDIRFNEGFREDYFANEDRFRTARAQLADEESKRIFDALVNFRITYDIEFMKGFEDRQDQQYFEPFLEPWGADEVFVDVGGYDGFTSREFIKRCPDYSAVHIFEPDRLNTQLCERNLAGFDRVWIKPMGLSDRKAKVKFVMGGSSSGVSSDGVVTIDVDRLDEILDAKPTFIKIDTEGSELEALKGAGRVIADHGPRLAVAVYHKTGDFWRIPETVLNLKPDYDVFLRHYTESIYETVMFFIPRRP